MDQVIKAKKMDPMGWPRKPSDGRGLRVLFINPPSVPYNALVRSFKSERPSLTQTIAMPMGILYLAATLERDLPGIQIQILDLAKLYRLACDRGPLGFPSFESFVDHTLEEEVKFVPNLIGVSILFSTAHKSSLRIAEACKRKWPTAPVAMGGMHATNAVEALLGNPAVDFVCRGEGEFVISDLVLTTNQSLPGIIGRDDLARTGSVPLIYSLDSIPYPAWHLLPMHEYVFSETSRARSIDRIEQDGEATIVTTRGCPYHCTFCASWTVHGREMRYRSTENVLGELRVLHDRYSVTTLIPEDDLFSVKKPRFLELCNAISTEFKRQLHFQFPNGLSVATLDAEVIAAMARMGMSVANIAIESGSNEVQRRVIKKNVNLDRARRVVSDCRQQGIFTRVYFILGFPSEPLAQMQETVDFAKSLPADWCVFNVAAPLVGTEMYSQLLQRGEIDENFNWDDAFFHERTFDTPEIGAQALKDFAYEANLRINFFGNYNLQNGEYDRAMKIFYDILKAYPGHLAAQWCIGEALRRSGREAEAEAAFKKAKKFIDIEAPLAMEQVGRFPHFFPWANKFISELAPAHGPRPGMPTAARATV